mgnify:CR=1 FL=1
MATSDKIQAKRHALGMAPSKPGRPSDIRALVRKHRDEHAATAAISKLNGPVQGGTAEENREKTALWILQQKAIELFARGHARREICCYLAKYIKPLRPEYQKTDEVHIKRVIKIFKEWEEDPAWRDRLWNEVQKNLDLQSAGMVEGVVKAAKRGRVDAAKFGLELAGRYTPKGEDKPAVVNIQFGSMPRPTQDWREAIEGEAEEVDD